MTTLSSPPNPLWENLVERHRDYERAFRAFLADGSHRVEALRAALRGPQRLIALRIISTLTTEEKQALLPEWVHLARCAHGPFLPAWNVLLSLPRDWVLAHIEPEVDAILHAEEEDDYWMFLQLYFKLDRGLTERLAQRAAAHQDANIRELGRDYLEQLGHATA